VQVESATAKVSAAATACVIGKSSAYLLSITCSDTYQQYDIVVCGRDSPCHVCHSAAIAPKGDKNCLSVHVSIRQIRAASLSMALRDL